MEGKLLTVYQPIDQPDRVFTFVKNLKVHPNKGMICLNGNVGAWAACLGSSFLLGMVAVMGRFMGNHGEIVGSNKYAR